MEDRQFYKVMRETPDGELASVLVHGGDSMVRYIAGKKCEPKYGRLFVYYDLSGAYRFADYYAASYSQPHWVFEVDVDRDSLASGHRIVSLNDMDPTSIIDMQIQSFWDDIEAYTFYYTTSLAISCYTTKWVIPTRALCIYDSRAGAGGRAINYHDRERVKIGKEFTKIYV